MDRSERMTKSRTRVPASVVADVQFASDQTCCVCTDRGKTVQIHHLDEDPSNHALENLAVLCLECHNKTQTRGGFGRSLTVEVVSKYRDAWLTRVRDRRRQADRLAVERTVGGAMDANDGAGTEGATLPARQAHMTALDYINALPPLKTQLVARAQPEWDTGITARMVNASYNYIDALTGVLSTLAGYYPERHFGDVESHEFFSEQIAARFAWHRAHLEPDGPGTGGTIVNVMCCNNVQADVETMVEDIVMSMASDDDRLDWRQWLAKWRSA